MGQSKIDIEKRRRIVTLRAEGKSFAKIAELAGVAKSTAVDECRRERQLINSLKRMRVEALCIEYGMDARERARGQVAITARMRDEIARRDLSDIPTLKLIELYLRQVESIEEKIQAAKSDGIHAIADAGEEEIERVLRMHEPDGGQE